MTYDIFHIKYIFRLINHKHFSFINISAYSLLLDKVIFHENVLDKSKKYN